MRTPMHYENCKCIKCNAEYKVPVTAPGLMFFCPECHSSNGSVSDYGFGPIAPCDIYEGERLIGTILKEQDVYRLKSDVFGLDENLTQGYKNLAVYHEAEAIIYDCIN